MAQKSHGPSPGDIRTILHIDLDAFYAQVEQKRLGIPPSVPLAVQQWEGLIAVNYPARAAGVTRHMRVGEAMKICPQLQCVHVETIGDTGVEFEEDGDAPAAAAAAAEPSATANPAAPDQMHQKACLKRYRRANGDIMRLLHRLLPSSVVEKASIDEVYIDCTAIVDDELCKKPITSWDPNCGGQEQQQEPAGPGSNLQGTDTFAWGSVVLGGMPDAGSEFDLRLCHGARIACRLRGKILEELGFTSSAGIATNKLLAKVGSGYRKPNQQTLILPRGVEELMLDLSLKKLRNFGGKLGAQLEAMGADTAGQVAALPHEKLVRTFGAERADYIAEAVRGRNNDPVVPKDAPKSMLSAKTFTPTSDPKELQRWLKILADELADRMAEDEETHRRRPKTLRVGYTGGSNPQERSRQSPMPRMPPEGPCAKVLASTAWEVFKTRCAGDALPCGRLTLQAVDFLELPAVGGSIAKFFKPQGPEQQKVDKGKAAEGALGHNSKFKTPHPNPQQQQQKGSTSGSSVFEVAAPRLNAKRPEPPAEASPPAKRQQVVEELLLGAGSSVERCDLPDELGAIDVAEQRRLLKEASMLKAAGDGRRTGGGGKKGAKAKQPNINSFFTKK